MTGLRMTLATLATLSALAAVPTASQAQNTTQPPANACLSPEKMDLLSQLEAKMGADSSIQALFAEPLELTKTGGSWPDRNVAAKENNGATLRNFAIGQGNNPSLVLGILRGRKISDGKIMDGTGILFAVRVRRDGSGLKGLKFDFATQRLTLSTPTEAQDTFNEECTYWANNVEGFLSQAAPK